MAINYKKLFLELKKIVPLLTDDKYLNFDLIQDYEITNSIEFESMIRTDEVKQLIEEMENEILNEEDKIRISKLYKRDKNEIEKFYENKKNNTKTNDLYIELNNPYFNNSYEKDLFTFGKLYNRPLEEFYKHKYENILNYYEINKLKIDSILSKYGLEFISLICKIYNIYKYSISYYERNFYYTYNSDLFNNKNLFYIEEGNIKIDDGKALFFYSRPTLKKNTNSNISLELDLNLPLNELTNKIKALKEHFEITYCLTTFNKMEINEKNPQIKINLQNNINKAKFQFYIIDCYKIIKKKYDNFTNPKIFEFLKELAIENNYQLEINDESSFNKLIKKSFK